jgi:hypothetical protein
VKPASRNMDMNSLPVGMRTETSIFFTGGASVFSDDVFLKLAAKEWWFQDGVSRNIEGQRRPEALIDKISLMEI